MSGILVNNLEQGTEVWKRWRSSGIGGSDAAVIKLGSVYGKTPYILWMEKLGIKAKDNPNETEQENLNRGNLLEPEAREYFIKHTGLHVEPKLFQSSRFPWMLASLDGITDDGAVGVEIKAPGEKIFKEIIKEGIPEHYYAQVQHEIAVTGAKLFYFFAYNKEIEPYIYLEQIRPDHAYIEELIRKEQLFWRHVEYQIAPSDDLEMAESKKLFVGLVMLAGYARSGKDAIGNIYRDVFKLDQYSPSDNLRRIHAQVLGMTEEEIAKRKEFYRDGMVALGDGMMHLVPDVWMQSLYSNKEGIIKSMKNNGAVVTAGRYVANCVSAQRKAEELGVPYTLVYIERPNVGPANDVEGKSLPLVKSIADVILYNDANLNDPVGKLATEIAVIRSLNVSRFRKEWNLNHLFPTEISSSQYLTRAATEIKTGKKKGKAK